MGFFESVMNYADPISASILTDQGQAIGVDMPDSHAAIDLYGRPEPYKSDRTGTEFDVNDPAKAEAAKRLDAQMALWRSKQKPQVKKKDDPRHKDFWPVMNKYEADWKQGQVPANTKQTPAAADNALSVGTRNPDFPQNGGINPNGMYSGGNSLSTPAPQQQAGAYDSPEVQSQVLNRYYGGADYGMFK